MTTHKTILALLLLFVPVLAMAKTEVIDIPAEQNYLSSYSWKIDKDTTLTLSRHCQPRRGKLFVSYEESYCNNSAYVSSTMADDSRTKLGFGYSNYTVTISNGETRFDSGFHRSQNESVFARSLFQQKFDPVVRVRGYGQISDDKLIKLDGLKQVKLSKSLIESDAPVYSIDKSVRLVGYRDAYKAIHDGAKAEFNAEYDAQNQITALILLMIAIATLGGSYATWKYVLKPGANKLNKTSKEMANKLEKNKVNKIAKEEAIRQTVRTTIENDNAAITTLKAQIKEALDNDDAKTAKILMEALDKIESKD